MRFEARPAHKAQLIAGLYDCVITVNGSRRFYDYYRFNVEMSKLLREKFAGKTVIFVSGKASTGGDAMIIDYCKTYGYPWVEMPADWEKHGKSAGYIRNVEMIDVSTHLVSFWDGTSRGTKHTIEYANKKKLDVEIRLIDVEKPEDDW